jgi:transcriptional regulatory protein GAL4
MDEVREAVPQSCVKCRRRKAKCDRSQPCSNCEKTGSDCTYESIFRTPLTRKHLTEVEDELARTKELLQQMKSSASAQSISEPTSARKRRATSTSNDHQINSYNFNAASANDQTQGGMPTTATSAHTQTHMSMPSAPAYPANESSLIPVIAQTQYTHYVNVQQQQMQQPSKALTARASASHPGPSPAFSLETPPAQGDFDWDERVRSSNRFIDGMASLTERSSRGYMGVASGAALLRLADDASADSGVDIDNGQHETANATPPIPALFTLAQLEPFVDAYFSTYHISYPIIHEATFRAQFMEIIPRPKGNSWQVLLHIVATMGAFAASETAPEIDLALFEAAKARMSIDMFETGNITLVQALTLTSNYVQKRNKPNSGYNYLGLAKRMALGIGLHKEFKDWHSRPLMLEIRRRVWWCLYIFDVGAIITFSRPLDLPKDGIEVQLPLNVSDSDITASTKNWPGETQGTTLYTHVRCQAKFHLATSSIYERLISTSFPTAEEMIQLDDNNLGAWLQELPAFFGQGVAQAHRYRLCHAILQWRWRNLRILMYRPYVVRRMVSRAQDTQHSGPVTPWDDPAIQRCLDTAGETVQLITEYWQSQTQNVLACWYALYFLFQAILVSQHRRKRFDKKLLPWWIVSEPIGVLHE